MKELLSIGSVVTLKEAKKKIMIIGVYIERAEDGKVYDYIALPYPEGYIDSQTMFLFMHEDIETIDYIGFVNAEHQAFRSTIADRLKEAE